MEFYYGDITIEVPEKIYYPREDSELMAGVIKTLDIRGKQVLEVGCGSGFLSILLAKKGARVTAIDINPVAVETAKKNAKANSVLVDCFESDLFEKVKNKFDLIVFNPPYLPVEEGEDDITYAGGKTGRDVIEKFSISVRSHLSDKGHILLLISSLTGEKETIRLLEKRGMKTKIVGREKIPWEELIIISAWRR